METKRAVCMQCHNACRLAATVDAGRLVSVEPDETFPGAKSSYPITKGCPRRRQQMAENFMGRRFQRDR